MESSIELVAIIVSIGLAVWSKSESNDTKIRMKAAEDRLEAADGRDRERIDRERVQAERTSDANKTRRLLFAHEAVELHGRWVQYARQVAQGYMLSLSQPFEWITFGTIEEFLRTGGEQSVISAVYRVKQLNFQVLLQIKRARPPE